MARINSYLTFNGNCREAMAFYKSCLGGELILETIGDSALACKLPSEMKPLVMHATLTNGDFVIMATDMVNDKGLVKGNSVSMMLDCDSETEVRLLYRKLSDGGEATHPIQDSFWGALFGDLTDKFGNQWLLHFDKNESY
ncbi:MAG TPA: VOC family protein [Flavobacterium sp.]|nr:VOC family protein [Flavobacterium sp.]